jgi:glycosyltransferase involved in cell wall biosynthesis
VEKKSNITFVLFSYNDAHRIEHLIRNVRNYGEVVVFDDRSTDNTQQIVEGMGVKFLVRPKSTEAYLETPEVFEFVKANVSTDWIYWGYTDNLLPKTLLEKMLELSQQQKYKYVYVPIYTYLWGDTKNVMITAQYSCFYMKNYVSFAEHRIHSLGKFTGSKDEELYLPKKPEYALRHYSLYDLHKYVTAHLRYAEMEALTKHREGKKFSVWYMFGSMTKYFWLFYKQGYKAGSQGLFISLLYAFFRLMVSVKMFEIEKGLDLETIEKKFAESKAELVKEVERK